MAAAVDVSVVMCTRNREHSIATAVTSVLACDYPSFDLTIVDQSTSDATWRAVEPIASVDPRLRYVHSEEAGLSRAYNRGIRESTGETLAFTDDDCVVGPNWLSTIVAAFEAEPDGDLLYGQVVPYEEGERELAETPFLMIGEPRRLSHEDGFEIFGMGANFAARRRLFSKVGYFDQVLGGGGALKSSQDFDLAYRTYKARSVILLRPEVTIRHDGRRAPEDWPALLRNYGIGDGAFLTKHVRCRDPYALWLLVRRVGHASARWAVRTIRRTPDTNSSYVRGVLVGIRESFKFRVDRTARIYVEP